MSTLRRRRLLSAIREHRARLRYLWLRFDRAEDDTTEQRLAGEIFAVGADLGRDLLLFCAELPDPSDPSDPQAPAGEGGDA